MSGNTFRPMSIVAKRSPISATAELLYFLLMHPHPHPHFTHHIHNKIHKNIRILQVLKSAHPQIRILRMAEFRGV